MAFSDCSERTVSEDMFFSWSVNAVDVEFQLGEVLSGYSRGYSFMVMENEVFLLSFFFYALEF